MPERSIVPREVEERARKGTDVVDIHALAAKWDTFYEADHASLTPVYEAFRERCVREGYTFPMQSFVYRNKVKPILQKRAEAVPAEFTYSLGEDEPLGARIEEWLEGWTSGPYFGDGANLWQALGKWNLWLERHGNLVLKLSLHEGQVYVSRVNVRNATVYVESEDIAKVIGWEFDWENEAMRPDGSRRTQRIREWIDGETFKRYVDDELVREDAHGFGFIPVVHVKAETFADGVWGRSVIEDLIEPQLMLAAAQSTIREVNRWAGWPAFAGTAPVSEVSLRPGGYSVVDGPNALWPLTWAVNTATLQAERDDYLSDLYEKGRVAQKSPDAITATGNLPSGKALLVLTQDGIQYLKGVVNVLEEAMSELLGKAAAMAGVLDFDPEDRALTVSYPPLLLEDEQVRLSRAKLVIESYSRNLLPREVVIEALLDLDILPSAMTAEEIMAALDTEAPAGWPGPLDLTAVEE